MSRAPQYDPIAINGPTPAQWAGLITWAAQQLRAGRTATGETVGFSPERAITCRSCGRSVEYTGSRFCPVCRGEL